MFIAAVVLSRVIDSASFVIVISHEAESFEPSAVVAVIVTTPGLIAEIVAVPLPLSLTVARVSSLVAHVTFL